MVDVCMLCKESPGHVSSRCCHRVTAQTLGFTPETTASHMLGSASPAMTYHNNTTHTRGHRLLMYTHTLSGKAGPGTGGVAQLTRSSLVTPTISRVSKFVSSQIAANPSVVIQSLCVVREMLLTIELRGASMPGFRGDGLANGELPASHTPPWSWVPNSEKYPSRSDSSLRVLICTLTYSSVARVCPHVSQNKHALPGRTNPQRTWSKVFSARTCGRSCLVSAPKHRS
jgi:hypothetical protein